MARTSSTSAHSVAAKLAGFEATLNATLETLPDRIGNAVREALNGLAAKADVDALEKRLDRFDERLRTAEGKHSYAAGAVTVENRQAQQMHDYIRAFMPLVWPAAIIVCAYIMRGGFNAG